MTRQGCEGAPSAVAPAVHQDITTCLAEAVGPGGIARDALDRLLPEAGRVLAALRQARAAGTQPFLAYADTRDDLAALVALANGWRRRFRRLVVLGTGGANLGGQALAATAAESERLLFLDNGDGDRLDRVLSGPDLDRIGFLVISKSGATAETLAQAILVLGGTEPVNVAAVITQPGESPLRRLASRFGITVLDHDPALGGRFSALSLVGLLPAMFAGVDGAAARDGAQAVLTAALEASPPERSAPALGAALAVAAMQAWPAASMVLMPYGPEPLFPRALVSAALGRVPRQGRAGLHSRARPRPGGPAQPAAALPGRPRRQPLHHPRGAGDGTPQGGRRLGRRDRGWLPGRAPLGRFDRGPGACHGHDVDRCRPPSCAASASRRPTPAPSVP